MSITENVYNLYFLAWTSRYDFDRRLFSHASTGSRAGHCPALLLMHIQKAELYHPNCTFQRMRLSLSLCWPVTAVYWHHPPLTHHVWNTPQRHAWTHVDAPYTGRRMIAVKIKHVMKQRHRSSSEYSTFRLNLSAASPVSRAHTAYPSLY